MSKKHSHRPGPVPPANQPKGVGGAQGGEAPGHSSEAQSDTGAGFNEQDPKRRLGGFETAGEHSRQQPGTLNDGDRHSK